jgi:hypothetical protein
MSLNLRKKQSGRKPLDGQQAQLCMRGRLMGGSADGRTGLLHAEVVTKILNLNAAPNASKDPASMYKVLILDRFTKDVIAPLLRVSDLRKQGVTLHLVIDAERQPIPDVPAIYLVQPSQANIERISLDAAAALYEVMHLNFTFTLSSKLMEQLATAAVKTACVHRIGKIFDQYLSFIALESSLFSLGLPDSYLQLNDPTAADHQIEVRPCPCMRGRRLEGRAHARAPCICTCAWDWTRARQPRQRGNKPMHAYSSELAHALSSAAPPRRRRSVASWMACSPSASRSAWCPSSAARAAAPPSTWPARSTPSSGTRCGRGTISSARACWASRPRSPDRCSACLTATSTSRRRSSSPGATSRSCRTR